jgi:hypothetical protein
MTISPGLNFLYVACVASKRNFSEETPLEQANILYLLSDIHVQKIFSHVDLNQ